MFQVSSTASLPLACASFALRTIPAGVIAALLASQSAQAAAVSWDAGGGAGKTAWNYDAETFVNWSDDATPTGDDVAFTATGAVSGSTTVTSTIDANYNINSLTIRDTAANYHNFDLGGFTLTVANGITIGDADTTAGGNTNVTMKNGTLTQSAGIFAVGPNSTVGTTIRTHTLDLRNLTAVNLTTTTIAIGSGNAADNQYNRGVLYLSSGTNTLAATNTYVASDSVGDGRSSNGNLYLSGSTALKSDNIYVGKAYGGAAGQISFASGGTPSVNIRNKAGTGAVGTFVIGDRGYGGTNTTMTGSVDLSGGTANALITNLRLADSTQHPSRTGIANGTLILGNAGDTTSIMDVTTAYLAADPSSGIDYVGTSNAILDIRGGTFRFDTMNVGADRGVYFNSNAQLLLKGGTFATINSTANTVSNLATLQIGGVGNVAFGQTSGGTGGLTLNSAAITLGGASNTVVANVATTLSGPISSTSNTLTLNGGSNLLTLSGSTANLNTGLVTVTTGELHLNKTAGVNAIGGDLTVDGGGAILDAANQLSDSAVVTVSSGQFNVGTLTETVGAFNMSGGLLGGSTGTITAATYGLSGGTVNANLGTGTLNVTGSSTLNGTSAAGIVAITGGTLMLGVSGSIATSSSVSIAEGAVLDTSARTSFALPAAQSYTLNVNGAGAGSCGSINAASLDIGAGVVVFNVIGTLDDAAYVLATHTGLTGSAFASVTPPAGYMIDYAYNGGTQIALVQTTTGFSSWIDDFGLSLADQDPGDDPDNDGMANVLEYVLNGNPSASDPSILPALDASGSNFIFTFTRREESSDDTTQVFEYGSNLTGWTPVAITGTPGSEVSLGTPSGGSPNLQSVTITIPKGTNTSLFGRLKVSQ